MENFIIKIIKIYKLIFVFIFLLLTNCSDKQHIQNMLSHNNSTKDQSSKQILLNNYSNKTNIKILDIPIQKTYILNKKQIKENLENIDFLYNKEKNFNESPYKFKVITYPISKNIGSFHIFDPRSITRERKLCDRLIEARNKTIYMPNEENETIALVSFIRKSAPKEDKCAKFFSKIVTFGQSDNFFKNTKLSINENYLSSTIIENTKLKLIKIYSFNKANINPNEYSNLKAIEISDNINKENTKKAVFTENIASFDFMGNLNSIPIKSYILNDKKSYEEYIRNKINIILSENMIFVSKDKVEIDEFYKQKVIFQTSSTFHLGKTRLLWQLEIDSNKIGVSIPNNYIVAGTMDFGTDGGFMAPIEKFAGKAIRKINSTMNKFELGIK